MKKIWSRLLIIAVLVIAMTASGCSVVQSYNGSGSGGGTEPYSQPSTETSGDPTKLENSLTAAESVTFATENRGEELSQIEAVKKVERSVVELNVTTSSGSGAGAGVIVDVSDSDKTETNSIYVITCNHMITDVTSVEVTLPDANCSYDNDNYTFSGRLGSAIYNDKVTLVGGIVEADIAVLKIDLYGSGISVSSIVKAKVMDTSKYEVSKGEEVFAIGNPTGTEPGWVSFGNVANLNVDETVEDIGEMTLLGISVDTNPGSSGGGLFNMYGELIGITNAGNTNYDGINFAIPLVLSTNKTEDLGVINVAKQLIGTCSTTNYGYISGSWKLGISITTSTAMYSSYIMVATVVDHSSAAVAGVQVGDTINEIIYKGNTVTITSQTVFSSTVSAMKAVMSLGETFTLNVTHSGTRKDTDLTLTLKQHIVNDTGVYPD